MADEEREREKRGATSLGTSLIILTTRHQSPARMKYQAPHGSSINQAN